MRRQNDLLHRPGVLARRLAVPFALAVAAACGEFPTSVRASSRGTFRGGSVSNPAPDLSLPLVGQWRRTLVFVDDFGGTNVFATLWNFRADGTFTRSLLTSNVNSGLGETEFMVGRWEIRGSIVLLTVDGASTPQRLTFFFSGANLVLGGTEYVRVL
jgi:hypothetical protein